MQSDICQRARPAYRAVKVLTWVGVLAGTLPALSAPLIQQVSGALNHKGTITISGIGFGSKPNAAPVVWDDATASDISEKWDGAWPNLLPGYNTNYYSPMRGINPPHSHDTRYIAGAHATTAGAYSGEIVTFFKNIPLQPFPFYIYASWYQRVDNRWTFGGDENFKTFAYSNCCSPYEAPNNWYTAYGPPHPASTTDEAQWLNRYNISACVLQYRLSPSYWYPWPLADGQRAVRVVRAHAQDWGINPNAIGVWIKGIGVSSDSANLSP